MFQHLHRSAKSRAKTFIIKSFFKLNTHKKYLALHCVLTNSRLIKKISDCDHCWKDDKRIYAALESLNNQNLMLKIKPEGSTQRGRKTDYKNSFIMTIFVSIVDTPASFTSNHTKDIDFLRSTK